MRAAIVHLIGSLAIRARISEDTRESKHRGGDRGPPRMTRRAYAARPGEEGSLIGVPDLHLWFGGVGLPLALNSPFLME